MSEPGNWTEWSQHVLKSLDRLESRLETVIKDVQDLKSQDTKDVVAIKIRAEGDAKRLEALEEKVGELQEKEEEISTKVSEWKGMHAIIGPLVGVIFSALVSWLVASKASGEELKEVKGAALEPKSTAQVIEQPFTPGWDMVFYPDSYGYGPDAGINQ
jgi:DNA repair exonuclease SbcCD ATPase subunit